MNYKGVNWFVDILCRIVSRGSIVLKMFTFACSLWHLHTSVGFFYLHLFVFLLIHVNNFVSEMHVNVCMNFSVK